MRFELLSTLALIVLPVLALAFGGIALLLARQRRVLEEAVEARIAAAERRLSDDTDRIRSAVEGAIREGTRGSHEVQVTWASALRASIERIREETAVAVADRFTRFQSAQNAAFMHLQAQLESRLDQGRKDSAMQLERIRATVDEKLQSTLETRLGESFRAVSERLEQLHRGLGEVKSLADGVGDLKRVLGNVKSRGTFGEVQLGALLEQVLAPEQYATNVATIPGSSARVEFAIKLPGRGEGTVYLPIDAKFPLEDYQRIQQAYEDSNAGAAEEARWALRARILLEARTIREKYLSPPHTTDFALMFFPTEGLYAEVLRIPGLSEELQSRARIVIAGPTTLFAVLSSLQMGFRTLAIEQRSSEVWGLLGAVKTEFAKFGRCLERVSKKLKEAGTKIAETSQRSRVMERKLRAVEALPDDASAALLLGSGSAALVAEEAGAEAEAEADR